METRVVRVAELRVAAAADDKRSAGRLSGHAAVWDALSAPIGDFVEVVRRGAFQRHLAAGGDALALHAHDARAVLGRRSSATLELREDDAGLAFDIDLPPTQLGRDVAVTVGRGDIRHMSFGFVARKTAWTVRAEPDRLTAAPSIKYLRELLDVDLLEISTTAFPAYEATAVAVRALHDRPEAEAQRELEAYLASRRDASLDAARRRIELARPREL